MTQHALNYSRCFRICIILALAWMAFATPSGAQKKGKNKDAPPPPDLGEEIKSAMRLPDAQAIDQAIGEAIGYWQSATWNPCTNTTRRMWFW